MRSGVVGLLAVVPIAVSVGIGSAAPASANGHPQFSQSGSLGFGQETVGSTSSSLTETITNLADGDTPFTITGVTLSGNNAQDFTITTDGCSGSTLGAHGTCTVSVLFVPTALGGRTANLHFTFVEIPETNPLDPDSPQDVALTGTGVAPVPQVVVRGGVVVPGAIPMRGTVWLLRAHTVTNAGQRVRVAALCGSATRGDARVCQVIRKKNGAVFLKTYGYHLKVRITWAARATDSYAAYRVNKKYRT